ncbi:MAG: outer membrane beta-barrel domain-containing protein [Deltaproteobacteria bacterium]|nr:outer membrane beta-barrel domain-containing protein [Deltaproteobacteria bacterium]
MRIPCVVSFAAMALFAVPALAAEDEEEPAEPKPDVSPLEPIEQNKTPESDWKSTYPEWMGKSAFPRIADDEETIYAVQRKAYLVAKKFEITPMASASFTDRFVQTFAPGASLTYHLAENFGLELAGSYMFPFESGLTTEILKEGKLTPEIAKLTQMLWGAGLGAQWSPIYGKLEVFGASLGNFAFFVGVAGGVGQSRVQCTSGLELDPEEFGADARCPEIVVEGEEDAFKVVYEPSRLLAVGAISGGVRFYFSNSVGLKIQVKDWLFPARVYRPGTNEPTQRYTDAIRNNVLVELGVSFLFGGEKD